MLRSKPNRTNTYVICKIIFCKSDEVIEKFILMLRSNKSYLNTFLRIKKNLTNLICVFIFNLSFKKMFSVSNLQQNPNTF